MDTVITSAKNPLIKQLRKLMTSSKARHETGMYVAEGIHLAYSYLTSDHKPTQVVCAESAQNNKEIAELLKKFSGQEVSRVIIANSLFESLSTVHASVGILILFHPDTSPIDYISEDHSSILLENIQDPGNIGTILRTATAAGVKSVILSSSCASPWSPKALRAGMGAQFGISIYEGADLEALVNTSPIQTLVTTLSSRSSSLYAINLAQPVAWIFGNEGQGVSNELAEAADVHVSIPQMNTPVESLNVAAAAAVCLYEQYRQQHSVK